MGAKLVLTPISQKLPAVVCGFWNLSGGCESNLGRSWCKACNLPKNPHPRLVSTSPLDDIKSVPREPLDPSRGPHIRRGRRLAESMLGRG